MNNNIFCISNAYIAEEYVVRLITENHKDVRFYMIISKIGLSSQLEQKYNKLSKLNGSVNILWIEDFNLNKIFFNFFKTNKAIKKFIDRNQNYSILYVQSMNDYVSRYVMNLVGKKYPSVFTVGLTLSIPVFLIRDPCFVVRMLKGESKLKEHIDKRCKLLNKHKPLIKNKKIVIKFKNSVVSFVSYIIDAVVISKQFRLNRLVVATSYMRKGAVDYHLAENNYWVYCLKIIYDEEVYVIKDSDSRNNKAYLSSNKDFSYDQIIILGPTLTEMVHCYVSDIENILKIISIKKILIRPHPRYILESSLLLDTLEKNLSGRSRTFPDVSISSSTYDEDFDLSNQGSIVLGYYSTVFDNLKDSAYLCLLSEGANHARYPYLDGDVLSGRIVGIKNNFERLSKSGEWYCSL